MCTPTQRLMRSRSEKVLAGVAGGIGQYLAIDPVIVRLAFAALCLTGVGVLLYPILWLVMPLEGSQGPRPSRRLTRCASRPSALATRRARSLSHRAAACAARASTR